MSSTIRLVMHVDLARTIAEFGGVDVDGTPALRGRLLAPVFDDQDAKIRDYVLFNQEWPWYTGVKHNR